MSIDKPEIDFPGGEPPADLEIKDIWEGDGPVAKEVRHAPPELLVRRAADHHHAGEPERVDLLGEPLQRDQSDDDDEDAELGHDRDPGSPARRSTSSEQKPGPNAISSP